MTLPDERYRALIRAEQFLIRLMDPKQTPRVPAVIRREAGSVLRHWPGEYYLERLAQDSPDILDSGLPPPDPLYQMVRDWDDQKNQD